MVGKALYGRLNGATSAGGRIYPLKLPQGVTYPAVTWQVIAVNRGHAFGGDGNVTAYRVQVDSWAATYSAARGLADEVKTLLSRWSGTAGGVVVEDSVLETELELPEEEVFRVMQEYRMFVIT